MSGNDQEEEPMDTSDNQPPPASHDQCAENKEEVQVTLSVERPEGFHQQKCEIELEKVLQSWVNNKNNKYHGDCKVLSLSEDGSAVISLKPAPALSELQKLSGQQLTGRDRKTVKIMSVSLTPPEVKTPKEAPEGASVKLPPSSESEQDNEKVHPMVQRSAVSAAGEEHRTCSVHHFWYVNHIYKEEIKRIEKENGVKIMAEVNVTFQGEQKDGDPQKALSEFTNLVQQCLGESHGSVIPLKGVNPEEWKDTVNIIQSKDNKLLLTVSSEEMTVCGPRQSQDAIRKSLTATTNTSTSFGESTWPSQDTPPNIGMSIQDPLVNAGLTMEERYWKLMTTSDKEVAKIKTKFGVDFKESRTSQGKVKVKACYKKSGGKASMESHAVRALLHLYQKIATSPVNFTQQRGAIGLTDLQSEGASGGPGLNGQPGYNTEAATGGGATAGDSAEDEDCPICMDKFTNKTQLKCKHEFCEECLAKARESMGGDICPVCKDVFGLIEGDQPDGNMTNYDSPSSLPGFPGCGSIIINYDIQGGMQTEKHSNPGKYYSGISRTAYLPNNKEGREVLVLLKKAFKQKLIFTVGTSRTSGMDNQVTWNDIHHKTSTTGGPQSFGYPDPGYLSRVKDELKAKGVE